MNWWPPPGNHDSGSDGVPTARMASDRTMGMDLTNALRLWTTYDREFRDDPYPAFAVLREHGPVHQVALRWGDPAWVIVGHAEARAALTDPRLSNDPDQVAGDHRSEDPLTAAGVGRHLLNADPPDHTRMRRLIGSAFTPHRVNALRPRVTEITDALLDDMAPQDQVELLDTFAVPLAVTVICELLGIPADERDTFRQWVKDLSAPAGDAAVVRSAAAAVGGYLFQLITAKQAQPGDDLLSALAQAHDDGRLDADEMMSNAFLTLVAGHETTVNLIGNGTVALLRHDQWTALGDDPDRIPDAVEELLRFDGPLEHATVRWTREDVALGDHTIPGGSRVFVILDAASRDPQRFTEADRLDLRRDTSGHLAFGHGIHYCVGAPLARLEGAIAFRGLRSRFPNLTLAVPSRDLRARPSLLLRSFAEVPVRLR
jgi:cytochrome P450